MNFTDTVILLPTYNERDNVVTLIHKIFETLPDVSVLVIDDNSPDGTADAVRELAKEYPQVNLLSRAKKEGLGRAYLAAFQEVLKSPTAKWLLMMDADHSHNPAYIPAMLAATKNGATFVTGSRYIAGGGTEGWEFWRRALSSGGNVYARIITGLPMRDLTAGFNLISTDILRRLDLGRFDSSGYAFQMELKHAMYRAGARFAEVPIIFSNRREGESKISKHIISEGIIAPWRMRFRK